jgi:predicted membrane-bound spermidine synthase
VSDTVLDLDQVPAHTAAQAKTTVWLYYVLFFLSGFPALLYQIVWQRALFTLFGVNIESVTVVVAVFMLGLGLGSLVGGALSNRPGIQLLTAFGVVELSIGAYGAASLWIFHSVGSATAGRSLSSTGIAAFLLLLIPTLLMGSTLPLLAEHFVRRTGNVGESVGLLYGVNTCGSGLACLLAAFWLMRMLGESGCVRLACCVNLFVGTSALILQLRSSPIEHLRHAASHRPQETIPIGVAMFLSGAVGFIALAYEILWYRLYSFSAGGSARCFAELLGFYLLGIAYGSRVVRQACKTKLDNDVRRTMAVGTEVVLVGSVVAFLVGPVLAHSTAILTYIPFVPVFMAANLLGAAFPLLAHAAIDPAQRVGTGISRLYLSNIIGSTLGSFVVGFWVLDHFSTRVTSAFLLGLGFVVALTFTAFAGSNVRRAFFIAECSVCAALMLCSGSLYSGIYELLLFKTTYRPGTSFSEMIENRSGVIAVFRNTTDFEYPTNVVIGGGVYDGRFNVDMTHDSNGLFRAFAVSGMHSHPKHVLMIGLASGSWAQVIANDNSVEDLTIVEINPGYVPLIQRHPEVESILRNPKVRVVIDDGRRWLVGHPGERFDFIVMNTTFHWRANTTNLLSTEFLRLTRKHLSVGGILYYNTTFSNEVLATGIAEFPYALRISSFLAVSDSPFRLDKARWTGALSGYRIDGKRVFEQEDPAQKAKMEEVLNIADESDSPTGNLESRASLASRLKGARLITDDNMGTEWQ